MQSQGRGNEEEEIPEWKRVLGSDPEDISPEEFMRICNARNNGVVLDAEYSDEEGIRVVPAAAAPPPPPPPLVQTHVQRIQAERDANPVPRPETDAGIPVSSTNQGARKLVHDAILASYNKERMRIDPKGVAKEEKKRRKEERERNGIVLTMAPKGRGASNAEKCRKYRERAKKKKEARVREALRGTVLETVSAMRATSPTRRLPKESDTPLPAPAYQGASTRGNQVLPARHCTIHTWVTVNGREFVANKQRELEAAVNAWMSDRNNKAFRQALQGGDTTIRFERDHPCAKARIPDVTMCESVAEIRQVLANLQGPGSYVARIEGAFERSVDLTSVWSGRVHGEAKSEEIMARVKALQPALNDGPLYNFLSFDHMGHWRARSELISFEEEEEGEAATTTTGTKGLDRLATDMRLPPSHVATPNYAHCTLKDVSQVLRNPRLVEAMTDPINGQRVGGVLLGYDALCREAVRQIPHDSAEWDRTSLRYDNQAWRRSQVWAPFFAALVARLCCLPLPSLEDLGVAGNWWAGREATHEGPHMRAVRHHLAHLTVARTVLDHIAHPKTGLWLRSRETLLATELGCDAVPRLIAETMRNYLDMRYNCLAQVNTLTAAWMAYVFGRDCHPLDYIPLSFKYRALRGDQGKMAAIVEYRCDQRYRGKGMDEGAVFEFVNDTLAVGVLMNKRHAALEAAGASTSARSDEMAQAPATFHDMDLSDGQLGKRMDAGIFLEAVWSSVRGDAKPYCVNGGVTLESVTIATMYRSYDLYTQRSEEIRVTSMPAGVVSRSPADTMLNSIRLTNQVVWAPVTYYAADLVKRYVDSCIDGGFLKASANASKRSMPWRLVETDQRTGVRRDGPCLGAAQGIVETFNERYYVVERSSPALEQASWVGAVDKINFATALRRVMGNSEGASELSTDDAPSERSEKAPAPTARSEKQLARRIRESVALLIGGSMRETFLAVRREQVLEVERECGFSIAAGQ